MDYQGITVIWVTQLHPLVPEEDKTFIACVCVPGHIYACTVHTYVHVCMTCMQNMGVFFFHM